MLLLKATYLLINMYKLFELHCAEVICDLQGAHLNAASKDHTYMIIPRQYFC